ncbi:MAG: hypothetical protein ACHREM_09070 [Polyangiales bacterium]
MDQKTAFATARHDMLGRAAWCLYQDGLFAEASRDDTAAIASWTTGLELAKQALGFARTDDERKLIHGTIGKINDRLNGKRAPTSARTKPPTNRP